MKLEIINDEKSNKLQLRFSKALNRAFNAFLRDLEIKKTQSDKNIYTADKIPAYDGFIENLQSLINSGGDWRGVNVFPVFEETYESIAGRKFIIINIHYTDDTTEKKEPHIIFQLWENDAVDLARSYGRLKYGENFVTISTAKKYIKEGRSIFEAKKIINQSIIDSLKKEKTSNQSIVETENNDINSNENKVETEVLEVLPEVENDVLVISKIIRPDDSLEIENVLVPTAAKEPFQSGNVSAKDLEIIRSDFPDLITKKDDDIASLTAIELFQLSQILYPEHTDLSISKMKIFDEQRKRGLKLYESLGYPSDLDYPHISLIHGYKNVRPLRRFIYSSGEKKMWWKAIAQARPIADLNSGIEIIDELIQKLNEKRKEYINPDTNTPYRIKGFKKKLEQLDIDIEQYKISKQNILDYLVPNKKEQTLNTDSFQSEKDIIKELREITKTIIDEFEVLALGLEGESEYIISTAKDVLAAISLKVSDVDFKNNILSVIYEYKGLKSDLDLQTRSVSNPLINKLEYLVNQVKDLKPLTIEKEIVVNGRLIKNVLVPKAALEPFASGVIDLDKIKYVKEHFPKLFLLNDSNIEKATTIQLFRLLQLEDHQKFGIDLSYTMRAGVVNKKGEQLFKELGYPLHYNYPYVNIRQGYKSVLPLSRIISSTSDYLNYANALTNWRPIADVSLAKKYIDELLTESHNELADILKNKNKFEDQLDFKDQYDTISTKIRFLESSKTKIDNYIFSISKKQVKEPIKSLPIESIKPKNLDVNKPLTIVKDIKTRDQIIPNVLIPAGVKEPFQSGNFEHETDITIKRNFPELQSLKDQDLSKVSSVTLFKLLQKRRLATLNIFIDYDNVRRTFNFRGRKAFLDLGYPTDLKYPYVFKAGGYKNVTPLISLIREHRESLNPINWDTAVIHARPVANLDEAINFINKEISALRIKQEKSFSTSNDQKVFERFEGDIERYKESKQVILDYKKSISDSILQNENTTTVSETDTRIEQNENDTLQDIEEMTSDESTSEIRHLLSDVISELLTLSNDLTGEDETIISTTIFDLEKAQDQDDEQKLLIQLELALSSFKDWVFDLREGTSVKTTKIISRLINALKNEGISFIEAPNYLSIAKDIITKNKAIVRVLVPILANEPFQSGGVYVNERENLKIDFPELYTITAKELPNISGVNLFRLSQLGHPQEYGIDISRRAVHNEIEHRGESLFEEIGFPTDINYPYININTGYNSIQSLKYVIDKDGKNHWWWTALEHWRPVADIPKATAYIDNEIAKLLVDQQEYINPTTKRVKTKKEYREAYYNLDFEIKNLKKSKVCLKEYLTDSIEEELIDNVTPSEPIPNDSYIDRVIVAMHDAYMNGQRLTKKKIEDLRVSTDAPSLGALWEAVELSWLLWYKRLYQLPLPFYDRLIKMDNFWKKLQPTYAYSDSSKELFKQYSTPCPIGAIIAQYTGMDSAQSIFEPSAGNGLLLVGADPTITHVNEIDKSRRKSLTYQRFSKITTENAALPFPKEMNKKYDVVVTNPPFAKWEDSKEEKAFIIREYFHNHRGMNHYIRLEHLMAGLALRTMKNYGKAAIIIMGHLSFDADGTWKKYRPFFSWLYRHYKVDDVINMNSYKLYNKQGAVKETMLILIGGLKAIPEGVPPNLKEQPQLDTIVSSFTDLWMRVQTHILPNIDVVLQQLKIAVKQ
ncbi:Eco57I restriction-modification methylase domain-containing protein [Kordia jejudonensis]|uniref:Eco57I restriction-modification methylase domain-containing protein n=1 Tax=Kordia jejudonensis TaxID=1348245 RepID=UPI00062934C2|nr:N-6 DNA methylase [Kordia jejudonensis]